MNNPIAVRNSVARVAALAGGRGSFRKQAWSSAFSQLSASVSEAQLAMAAHLIGREADSDYLYSMTSASVGRDAERIAGAIELRTREARAA